MGIGTRFGSIHSSTDLALIQQKVEITPPAPKLNIVDIPGADGSKDLTEALGVGVKYEDRTLTWTFAMYPGTNKSEKRTQVVNALHGRAFDIVLDEDPGWVYHGRVAVTAHTSDKSLHTITVTATCYPYKREPEETSVSRADLNTNYKNLECAIGAEPQVPVVTVGQETTLKWGDLTATVSAGEHILPGLFMSGTNTIKAKLPSGADGTITITWRKGSF